MTTTIAFVSTTSHLKLYGQSVVDGNQKAKRIQAEEHIPKDPALHHSETPIPGVPGHQCTHPRNDQHCHDSATAARDKSAWKCYPASKILATKDPKVHRAADLAKERRERSSTEGTSCGRLRGKRITPGNDAGRAAIWACLGNGWTPEGVRIRAGSGNLGRWGKGRGVQRKFLVRDLHF